MMAALIVIGWTIGWFFAFRLLLADTFKRGQVNITLGAALGIALAAICSWGLVAFYVIEDGGLADQQLDRWRTRRKAPPLNLTNALRKVFRV